MTELMEASYHITSHLPAVFLSLSNVVVSGFQSDTRKETPICKWFHASDLHQSKSHAQTQIQDPRGKIVSAPGGEAAESQCKGAQYREGKTLWLFLQMVCHAQRRSSPGGTPILFSQSLLPGTSHLAPTEDGCKEQWRVKPSEQLDVTFVSNDRVIPYLIYT